jgi:hypothetical protein
VDKKRQHLIPNSYLKAWCDPLTPKGQAPYIWRISKDGKVKKKKSPHKSFTETDRYTIKLPSGQRSLLLEDTLANLENDFVRLLPHIHSHEKLSDSDRAKLCVFAAAMQARTRSMGEHWREQIGNLHELVVSMDKQFGGTPTTSKTTGKFVQDAHLHVLVMAIKTATPLLFDMAMSVLICKDELGFITSDTPCVWFNPQAYKLPPFYRGPGLAQRDIEVTLPLTPQYMLLISHNHELEPYIELTPFATAELNRRTLMHCDEEFVSWKGGIKPYWFEELEPPDDAWENRIKADLK